MIKIYIAVCVVIIGAIIVEAIEYETSVLVREAKPMTNPYNSSFSLEVLELEPVKEPWNEGPCAKLTEECVDSKLPCCQLVELEGSDKVLATKAVCFKFGRGICESEKSIPNFSFYNTLSKELTKENFDSHRKYYWRSVLPSFVWRSIAENVYPDDEDVKSSD